MAVELAPAPVHRGKRLLGGLTRRRQGAPHRRLQLLHREPDVEREEVRSDHLAVAQAPKLTCGVVPELDALLGVEHHHAQAEVAEDALEEELEAGWGGRPLPLWLGSRPGAARAPLRLLVRRPA